MYVFAHVWYVMLKLMMVVTFIFSFMLQFSVYLYKKRKVMCVSGTPDGINAVRFRLPRLH